MQLRRESSLAPSEIGRSRPAECADWKPCWVHQPAWGGAVSMTGNPYGSEPKPNERRHRPQLTNPISATAHSAPHFQPAQGGPPHLSRGASPEGV